MADTPIDQAANLTSIRLKVPTGTVPVPPPGHLQLHAPDYDTLAVRRGDGSVVEIGASGPPETPFMLLGSGGTVDTSADSHGVGVTIATGINKTIRLAAPLVDANFLPFGVQITTTQISSAELLALHVTPKVLRAAIPGRVVLPLLLIGVAHQVTSPFDNANNFRVGWGGDGAPETWTANLLQFNGLQYTPPDQFCYEFLSKDEENDSDARGRPLVLGSSVALTGGDGSFTVTAIWIAV
jgi:hypothetical protein